MLKAVYYPALIFEGLRSGILIQVPSTECARFEWIFLASTGKEGGRLTLLWFYYCNFANHSSKDWISF